MTSLRRRKLIFCAALAFAAGRAGAQGVDLSSGPDPKEIPVPEIITPLGKMPGVKDLPVRKELPDVMTMNDGTKVTTPEQWAKRREEMKKILEYYAVGVAPPAPGNVKGKEIKSQLVLDGKIKYRLIHLTFGPEEKLWMDIGIWTPTTGGPFPTVIGPGAVPDAQQQTVNSGQGPNQGRGEDVLLLVGPATQPAGGAAGGARVGRRGPATAVAAGGDATTQPARGRGPGRGGANPEGFASSNYALQHGFAYVAFRSNDCAEDSTLRNMDGSFAFRNTRFYPAYPGYDWGVLRGWAWGVSRVVDYLETDPSIDKTKLIITGVSREGKSALIAGAFDERISMVAPGASSGGGTPAYRFSGQNRGGHEGLSEMVRKYPNWFSPHLHEFWGHQDQLPFDEHWFIALCAPRPFIALEGTQDQNVQPYGVRQSFLHAQPAYDFLKASDKLGINWAVRPHGFNAGDQDGMLSFADKHLMGKPVPRVFNLFTEESYIAPGMQAAP